MIDEDVEDFLAHYGIKGMHWGIRNSRPTSVSAETIAKREKKAKNFDKRAARAQRSLDILDTKTPRSPLHAQQMADTRQTLLNRKARAEKDAARKRAGKLTSTQRKDLAIGGAVLGLFVAAMIADNKPMRDIPKKRSGSVEDLIRQTQDEQMYSLRRMHQEGKMDKAQFEAFSKKLNERYDRKVADALRDAMT